MKSNQTKHLKAGDCWKVLKLTKTYRKFINCQSFYVYVNVCVNSINGIWASKAIVDCTTHSQYDLAMYIYSFSVQLSAYAYSFLDYRVSN